MTETITSSSPCRICMDAKIQQVSIFSGDLSRKVSEIADVQIQEGDGLPPSICEDCEIDLERCYRFRTQIIWADTKFRERLSVSEVVFEECHIKQEGQTFINEENQEDDDDDRPPSDNDDDDYDMRDDSGDKIDEIPQEKDQPTDPIDHVEIIENRTKQELHNLPSTDGNSQDEPLIVAQMKRENEPSSDPLMQSESQQPMDTESSIPGPSTSTPTIEEPQTGHNLPDSSRIRYEEEYKKFSKWRQEQSLTRSQVSDDLMMTYMTEKGKEMKPSTLWCRFSMLKTCLKLNENVDLSNFKKTLTFLKQKSVGYKPKKTSVFTTENIVKFMTTAPDQEWLLTKVILALGIYGACRREDMVGLTIDDVQDNETYISVYLRDGKPHRVFNVTNEENIEACTTIRKYMSLRPSSLKITRFLICYRRGKCVAQPVGIHTIGGVPRKVAEYLKLADPGSYTGRALRRSSASLLVPVNHENLQFFENEMWMGHA